MHIKVVNSYNRNNQWFAFKDPNSKPKKNIQQLSWQDSWLKTGAG